MDTSEGTRDDHRAAVEAGLKSSMLARAAFAVVVVDDESPGMVPRLEALGYCGDSVRL